MGFSLRTRAKTTGTTQLYSSARPTTIGPTVGSQQQTEALLPTASPIYRVDGLAPLPNCHIPSPRIFSLSLSPSPTHTHTHKHDIFSLLLFLNTPSRVNVFCCWAMKPRVGTAREQRAGSRARAGNRLSHLRHLVWFYRVYTSLNRASAASADAGTHTHGQRGIR